jgi:hypothetical protein
MHLMHCITLLFALHALHYFNCGHLLHIRVDHVEPKMDNEAEQVQWVFRIHKRQVAMMLTLLRIKARPGALTNAPCLLF